jgi:hypothetical protein
MSRQNLPTPRQDLARYTDLAQSSQSLNRADTCRQILELLLGSGQAEARSLLTIGGQPSFVVEREKPADT